MKKGWSEPTLDDLLSDPILDVLLTHDRVSRDDLDRVITEARRTLARVPRQWHVGGPGNSQSPSRFHVNPITAAL